MAARKRLYHDPKTIDHIRQTIKVSQLVNALNDHVVLAKEMSATQIRAAEVLLRKVMPDLASVEHSGEIVQNYVARMPEHTTASEWQKQHSGPLKTLQ